MLKLSDVQLVAYTFVQQITKHTMTHTITTANKTFWNFRKFDVEYSYSEIGNIAVIKENGITIWEIYANTARTLNSQVTKWCKANW